MADADRGRIIERQQRQRWHDSGPDRLRIRSRLQPRIQKDDRRGAARSWKIARRLQVEADCKCSVGYLRTVEKMDDP